MKTFLKIKLSDFPFLIDKKVSDLVFVDEPILSHFITNDKKNLFFYLIDLTDEYNHWLVFEVLEENLYSYIKGEYSLRDLILNSDNDFVYTVKSDDNFILSDPEMIKPESIEQKFLPSESSFNSIEVNKVPFYLELELKYSNEFYKKSLEKSAYFLKIDSVNKESKRLVTLNQLSNFVSLFLKSYTNYSEVEFKNIFKSKYTDQTILDKAYSKIKKPTELYMTAAKAASFEIGLAIDKIMLGGEITDLELKRWAKNIFSNYRENVIELDYEDEEIVEAINKKYDYSQRQKIYKPFFDLINNNELQVSFGEKKEFLRPIGSVKKDKVERILPRIELEETKGFEIVKYVVKQEIGKQTIRLTDENTLFCEKETEDRVRFDSSDYIKFNDAIQKFLEGIEFYIKMEGKMHILYLTHKKLQIEVGDLDYKEAKGKLISRLIEIEETEGK